MSHIEHHGRIVRDIEIRFSNSGTAIGSTSIAVNERVKDKTTGAFSDGEASFHNVVAFGQMAEMMAETLKKGDLVLATGDYKQRKYKTASGEERTAHETVLDDIGKSLKWLNQPKQDKTAKADYDDSSVPF